MTDPIACLHMNHLNAVVDGYDETIKHFTDLYGAQFFLDVPRKPWHAFLLALPGNVIFEFFAPHDPLLHARSGPQYVGIEYQVDDVATTRNTVRDRGCRIVGDEGPAFHTHPADCQGVGWEFYGENFHAVPSPVRYLEPFRPMSYWADEHPLGALGLKRYSVAVEDLDAARRFHEEFVDGHVRYTEDRPAIGAKALGIDLADVVVEILSPTGPGILRDHLARWGDGIRSTVFQVKSLEAAQRHFASKGVTLVPGDAPSSLAIRPEDNAGLLFEFSE